MSKEYDTNDAWGDAPRGYHQSQAEYWRSMCKSLREVLAEKEIYIEQLQKRLEVEEKKKSIEYSDEFIEAFGTEEELMKQVRTKVEYEDFLEELDDCPF